MSKYKNVTNENRQGGATIRIYSNSPTEIHLYAISSPLNYYEAIKLAHALMEAALIAKQAELEMESDNATQRISGISP